MRDGRKLVRSTREFATEFRARSWWHFLSTATLFAGLVAVACVQLPWPLRLLASVFAALVHIRFFVLFHDHEHGSLLADSKLASVIFRSFGLLTLVPPSIWKHTHDHHHRNNARSYGVHSVGTYPVLTPEAFRAAKRSERIFYVISRHPLTIALGYFTVFLWGFCLLPLLTRPRHHLDAALSILLHFGLIAVLAVFRPDIMLFALVLPTILAAALGSYLFYAQHNCPGIKLRASDEWDYVHAALESSSFTKMNPLMHWFTGNIGYHHVHHLNARIPFYRLPEAMATLEDLRSPVVTSLHPRDVLRCLRLKLWDPRKERFVSFREARRGARAEQAARRAAEQSARRPAVAGIGATADREPMA